MLRIAAIVFAIALPALAAAEECQPVALAADFTAGDIHGNAPADGIVCYALSFPKGQNMSIELVEGKNVSVTVPGYYDDRPDRQFIGDLPGQLEIRVFQLFRAPGPQPFVLRLRFEEPGNG